MAVALFSQAVGQRRFQSWRVLVRASLDLGTVPPFTVGRRRSDMLHLVLWIASWAATQDARHAMNERGAMVMGFDQEKTAHHFYLYADGGAIDIGVKHLPDPTNVDAIRSHLPHIATMFGGGNFSAPIWVHDSRVVPGIATLTERKDMVQYTYIETPRGGRVDIVTTDPQALSAVHEFLK